MITMLFALLTSHPIFAADINPVKCIASYRHIEANGKVIEKELDLAITGKYPELITQAVNLEGRQFSIQQNTKNGDLLSFIIRLDDTTKGLVGRGALDSAGNYASTDVDGSTVFKLACTRR